MRLDQRQRSGAFRQTCGPLKARRRGRSNSTCPATSSCATRSKNEKEIIRADECYYDVNRNVAIAIRADLEIQQPTAIYPIHFKADELQQLNAKLFLAKQTEIYSTVLPSDPGLKIQVREAKIEEFDTVRKSIFGTTVLDRKTGKPIEYQQHVFTGESNVIRLEGVPIFYFPYLTANVERPLGPLDAVSANYNKIFGFQLLTTFDMYELLGLQRPENNRWKLFLDEMTAARTGPGHRFSNRRQRHVRHLQQIRRADQSLWHV